MSINTVKFIFFLSLICLCKNSFAQTINAEELEFQDLRTVFEAHTCDTCEMPDLTGIDSLLVTFLAAKSIYNRDFFLRAMQRFLPDSVPPNADKKIRDLFTVDTLISQDLLLFVGLLDNVKYLPDLSAVKRRSSQDTSYKSVYWAATLGLSRIGDKKSETEVLDRIGREENKTTTYTKLAKHLAYINSEKSFNMILSMFMSNEFYEDIPNEQPYRIEKTYYASLLGEIIYNKIAFDKSIDYFQANLSEIQEKVKFGKYKINYRKKHPIPFFL